MFYMSNQGLGILKLELFSYLLGTLPHDAYILVSQGADWSFITQLRVLCAEIG